MYYRLSQGERRLAAIVFTDMVGFTALTQSDESHAMEVLERHNRLVRPFFPKFHGQEVKAIGDSFLVEFQSALDALNCAVEIQSYLHEYNASSKDEWKIKLRIGIHLGDVIHQGGDVFGDAVNIASRMEPVANPEGICLSKQVFDQVHNKFGLPLVSEGEKRLKNMGGEAEVYRVQMPWEKAGVVPADRAGQADRRRIAVLPFANISHDPDDEYFADGMTEELISSMARISGLRVVARTSVMGYKVGQKKIADIAKELDVGTIMEGSVRKVGDRVRISVQLIDSQTSEHLWVETYNRDLKDLLAVQSEIAETVADALKIKLLSQERAIVGKRQTVNPEAYTLYLKGRFYWNERTKENVDKAIDYFERAVEIDSKFAQAFSGLADCYGALSNYSWMPAQEAGPKEKEYATKAVEIDDALPEAHASLGFAVMEHEWDFGSAEREYRRALELGPNYAPTYHWYALLLIYRGRLEDALSLEKKALELDPFSRTINMMVANLLGWLGMTGESMERFNKLIDLNPDFGAAHFWKASLLASLSEYDEAIDEAKKAVELRSSSASRLQLAWIYAKAGKKEEAEAILHDSKKSGDLNDRSGQIATVEFELGHEDEGFRWLERALSMRDTSVLMFGALPLYREYRSDPRWVKISKKLGLSDIPK